MKRMIVAWLNRLGLYTNGQIHSVLGRPLDQVLQKVQELPARARPKFEELTRCCIDVAVASVGGLARRDVPALEQFLRQLPQAESQALLVNLGNLYSALDGKPEAERKNVFGLVSDAIHVCAHLNTQAPPRGDLIQRILRQVTDLSQQCAQNPQAWHDDALPLLQALLALLHDKQAVLYANVGSFPPETLLDGLSQSLNALRKELPFRQAQAGSRIRELYLAEIFDGITEVSIPIGAINEETGHANATDLLFVSAIARHKQARNLFEIGTYMGRTTYHLTFASDDAIVTTVNLPPEAEPRLAEFLQIFFRGRERAARIHQVWADSSKLDTTPYRGRMDFVFVDGDHSYEAIKADTVKAFDVLAPGGIIVWHDYAAKSPGVYRFFQEFTQTRPVFRVRNTCLAVYIDGVDPMTFRPHSMLPSMAQKIQKRMASSGVAA